jgi:hypothetical protein
MMLYEDEVGGGLHGNDSLITHYLLWLAGLHVKYVLKQNQCTCGDGAWVNWVNWVNPNPLAYLPHDEVLIEGPLCWRCG